MKAYKLLKAMPGLDAGTVFLHDDEDQHKGSVGHGCLKNAWRAGSTQSGYCAETHILPGQMASDKEWFLETDNKPMYHL